MDSRMNVERSFDNQAIRQIMIRPDMWATVAEDGQDPDVYMPDTLADCWLRMEVDGDVIALYQLQTRNSVTLEIHAQVLPEFRKEHSKETGKAALQWILDNTECQKVIAWVPAIYPNVRDFTVSQGFQIEGTNRESYMKNGEIHDQTLLGITRKEMEKIL